MNLGKLRVVELDRFNQRLDELDLFGIEFVELLPEGFLLGLQLGNRFAGG